MATNSPRSMLSLKFARTGGPPKDLVTLSIDRKLTEKLPLWVGWGGDCVGASRKGREGRKGPAEEPSDHRARAHFSMKNENEIAKIVLDAAFKIHTDLGPGLLESVYEAVLAYELVKSGVEAQRQVQIPIRYRELIFEEGFRADLVAAHSVVVELKSVEKLLPIHAKQVLTQLKLSGRRLGLLINFGEVHLKDGIRRLSNGLPD